MTVVRIYMSSAGVALHKRAVPCVDVQMCWCVHLLALELSLSLSVSRCHFVQRTKFQHTATTQRTLKHTQTHVDCLRLVRRSCGRRQRQTRTAAAPQSRTDVCNHFIMYYTRDNDHDGDVGTTTMAVQMLLHDALSLSLWSCARVHVYRLPSPHLNKNQKPKYARECVRLRDAHAIIYCLCVVCVRMNANRSNPAQPTTRSILFGGVFCWSCGDVVPAKKKKKWRTTNEVGIYVDICIYVDGGVREVWGSEWGGGQNSGALGYVVFYSHAGMSKYCTRRCATVCLFWLPSSSSGAPTIPQNLS